MNIRYKLKKRWFSFWQKYKLRTQLRIASRLFLLFVIIWFIGSALTILSEWGYTDNFKGTPFQAKYLNHSWAVIIELVSGYEMGDLHEKLNPISNFLSIIVVVSGIVIFAVFTGQIVSMFVHVLHRYNHLPEKPENFIFHRPIIICGINSKLDRIIQDLKKNPLSNKREIIIIDREADKLKIKDKVLYKDVWYVKGNQGDRNILNKSIGCNNTSAIILASESSCESQGRYTDSKAIETALAIEGYRERTHTVLELVDERNIPYLSHTRINEWISIYDYGIKLTAQATLQHGMGCVFHYLLGGGSKTRKANQIYFSENHLPETFNNLTFEAIRDSIRRHDIDITPIGFARFIPDEFIAKLGLSIGPLPYIKQLNPVSRSCMVCGISISNSDELGRIQKKCSACFEKERSQNRNASNPWYYPKDIILNREDKIIYLSEHPVDFQRIKIQ